jgi:diguanylate cyclase (GGDEF)-like protein
MAGHERGDDVLAAVGAVLSETVRASDFVGRNGGEEFIVLLPDTDADQSAGRQSEQNEQPLTVERLLAERPDASPMQISTDLSSLVLFGSISLHGGLSGVWPAAVVGLCGGRLGRAS